MKTVKHDSRSLGQGMLHLVYLIGTSLDELLEVDLARGSFGGWISRLGRR
jgi:hypothetical protein